MPFLLSDLQTEAEYDARVEALDEILALVGDDETHPLAGPVNRLGDIIESYDEAHSSMPEVSGSEVLRYLMQEHGIAQSELPEFGAQSVVSEVLNGRRKLKWRKSASFRSGLTSLPTCLRTQVKLHLLAL